MNPAIFLSASLIFLFSSQYALAREIPVQARLFGGILNSELKDVNTELAAQDLKEMKSVLQFGVELDYPLLKFFNVGLRYSKRMASQDELTSNPTTDYKADLGQDALALVGRIPILKSNIARLDGFAGFGGTNTILKLKTATQDGEISKKAESGWFASPYLVYGASVAFGYRQFYVFFEGGFESNKADGLKRDGSVNSNIIEIDMSGSYLNIGFLFDGVSASAR